MRGEARAGLPPRGPSKGPRRLLLIGDPHFQLGLLPRCKEFVREALALTDSLRPDAVVCLGDVLHTHSKVHLECLSLATGFLVSLSRRAPLYLIVGNHDRRNNKDFCTEIHAFNGLKQHERITVVDKPLQRGRFVFCPYVYPGRFDEALRGVSGLDLASAWGVFCHQEFRGARMGSVLSEKGDEILPGYPTVFSGHVHDYQRLPSEGAPRVLYTGSPMQHGHGDGPGKTVSLVSFGAAGAWTEERHSLPVTRLRTVRMTCREAAERRHAEKEGCLTRVVVTGTEAELASFRSSRLNTLMTKTYHRLAVKPLAEPPSPGTPGPGEPPPEDFLSLLRSKLSEPEAKLLERLLSS